MKLFIELYNDQIKLIMNWSYKFIDHTADLAVEITGETPGSLLHAAYHAWLEFASDPYTSDEVEDKNLEFSESSFEELIVGFLSELNYLFLVKKWITLEIVILHIEEIKGTYNAKIKITGCSYGSSADILKSEIKAVTFHQMDIKKVNGNYSTRIVFDI